MKAFTRIGKLVDKNTIINQKTEDVVCVYVGIGQKASTIAQVVNVLRRKRSNVNIQLLFLLVQMIQLHYNILHHIRVQH
jgi:hypothetical protein